MVKIYGEIILDYNLYVVPGSVLSKKTKLTNILLLCRWYEKAIHYELGDVGR